VAQESSGVIDDNLLSQPLSRGLRLDVIGQRLALAALVIGIWWLSSLSVPHYILPGPARVWDAFQLILANGDLWNNLVITLWRVAAGFSVAALVGLPFGIVLGANKRRRVFEPVIPVLNTVSSAIWAIFAIIWFVFPTRPLYSWCS
jgi:NitT/TauT family transport system permease protein